MTRIAVTHSALVARAADRVVVLDGGAVVASGSYEELLASGGVPGELFDSGVEPRSCEGESCEGPSASNGMCARMS
jgi:ABC-type transport system involved in cytochrome bd biosynthesis fused ATPase/permease subunit